jgi:hypothetical protein
MAIPLSRILKHRAACPNHIQASLFEVEPPARWPGPATVHAKIERVFRGAVLPGDTIVVQMNTVRTEHIPAGDFFYAWEGLRAARFIEVCLDGAAGSLRLPNNSCSTILQELTESPVLELAARRRSLWQRLLRRAGHTS